MTALANTTLKTIIEAQRQFDYPELPLDKYFEIFSAQQVLKKARYNPDPEEITSGMLGGDGDAGVDGFYVYCNRRLIREDNDIPFFKGQRVDIEIVVVQAKNKSSFEESVPMKFKDFVENCLVPENPTHSAVTLYSQELLDHVAQFRTLYKLVLPMKPTLSVEFFHVAHSETVDPKVAERGDILCNSFKQSFPTAKCLYTPITGTELIILSQKREESTLELKVSQYFNWRSFERDAYTCVVKLADFYSFISGDSELREHIFEANVRDYAPDAKVNEGIQATLVNPGGDDFWWLNNGITVIATSVYFTSGSLQITDPLIVNGLQTSHEVFHHFKAGGDISDNRSIMVKVIVNSNDTTSDRIISATNSQTKISSIFLHSTEQIHRDIELNLKAAGYFYDRRKNYYRNRGKSVSEIITIHYLAQAVASILLQQPDNARVRPGTVAEKNYKKLFSQKYPPNLYTNCIKVMKRCYKFLADKGLQKTDVLNLVFYLAMYVICAACNSVTPKTHKIAALEVEKIDPQVFEKCYEWISSEFKRLGGDDRVAKGPLLTESLKAKVRNQFGKKRK